jgi:toxin ParE1/3/4
MSRYRLDHGARADLDDVYHFIAKENRSAALRLMETFKEKFRLLSRHPLLGELREELAPDLRSFSVGNYIVFYRAVRGGIAIARVIHGARDHGSLL